MPDMLVRLYDLPPLAPVLAQQAAAGVRVHRALATDRHLVLTWVEQHFSAHWQSECVVAFARQPISCYVAVADEGLVGFACHEVTCKNFFGPTGVAESHRGRGIGKALLLVALYDMLAHGYAYAIIGGVGPADFYEKAVGATLIEGSDPGVYAGMVERH